MDDEFDDDSLDFIPDNTLHQLEQRAFFTSTQKQKQKPKPKQPVAVVNVRPVVQQKPKPRIQTYGNNAGLSRNNNNNNNNNVGVNVQTAWKPPQPRGRVQASVQVQDAPPASAPEPPSSDYGLDEEEVIDLDERSATIPPASGLPNRSKPTTPAPVPARTSRHGSKAALDPETEAAFAAADAELGAPQPVHWQSAPHLQPKPADTSAEMEALQAKLAALEAEQARLRQSEKQAREAAFTKQGEIAIVRSKQDQAVKEYERRIAVMQKVHTDETSKWKSELEGVKKEKERMSTDNRFLQHDLAQEVEKGKRLTGPGKARTAVNGMLGTPRKNKRATQQGLGDGFEDDEVRMVSPSRSREKEKDKSREQTPRAGAKRKRPVNDSPVPALPFSQPAVAVNGGSAVSSREPSFHSQVVTVPARREDRRYEFMQRLLLHTPAFSTERTLEALAKHHFPSDTRRSLSSLLLDSLTAPNHSDVLALKASRAVTTLWTRTLMEKFYAPIPLLLDLLRFVLDLETAATKAQLIEETVPLVVHCIEKVATIAFQVSKNPAFSTSPEYNAQVVESIDLDEMLDFLLELAGAASLSPERIERFWRGIELPTLMLMLNKALSIEQLRTALRILSTSTLEPSFGPIFPDGDEENQAKSEKDIVDRLTILLFDIPSAEPAYDTSEIAELRVEVLHVLRTLCATVHGAALLAGHRSFLGRLVRFLERQVNSLYDVPPTFGMEALSLWSEGEQEKEPTTHDLLVQTISTSTRLLYHLLRTSDANPAFSILTKLQAVKGGYHKFLVALTRLAFSEQLVFEHGIGDEVVEAAHTILDNVLSPEEGEAIIRAVETPRGTKGSLHTGETTERDESGSEGGEGVMEEEPG